ncbi:thioredoxin-disulfide reductase [Clostridium tertium]|jgi:thioredoxin reductase (NADPH)|uniref:thioredoxin-disulfide reductase n=1 Tax=Clostridium tertium TaxID=1559 RepID=UPI000BE23F93|nr:thioredoxin-disulfide reductase [Clostridium tertium]MDB1939447.1 thioredoxin-disulfide reductase [Clostridium tertium]MDB1955751.1 thioredoxin-disulfide reductase [Clostridium tertium]MDB1957478.1 thioredoxin-disulfide reductase [Clostridium tertium]MDB1961412.1 thioredoxin-disulfide reductase [Clostridium tertium]MDB1966970.1 thioredoxin-disulfide reductase [Clostridium tertium]
MNKIYDLIIIGGGPAGLSAGLYAGRARLNTLIIEKEHTGGQINSTAEIVNYPGIVKTTGPNLTSDMRTQAENFGVKFQTADVIDVDLSGDVKIIKTNNGEIQGRAIIIATGASPRKLGFPGEIEYGGRGVAYCATCDGEFFKDLEVLVIGAGYAAAEEAIYLTRFAKKVIIVAREPEFTCAKSIGDKVKANKNIEIRFNTEVVEAIGDDVLRSVKLINNVTNERSEYFPPKEDGTFGIFVFVGYEPQTKVFKDKIEMDRYGYILTNENMETNIKGVYAAGDLRPKLLRQVVTAVADGAIAATDAERYVASEKERLGIIEEEVIEEKVETKNEVPTSNNKALSGRSNLLNDTLRNQLKGILSKIENNISLVSIVDESNKKSIELRDLVLDISDLSDKISAVIYKKGENLEMESKIHADKYPVVALLNKDSNYSGVKFHGVPGGHELNSFILAIYNLAGPGQALNEDLLNEIKSLSLDKKTNIKVAVSLSCHVCPEVVTAAQRIAIENPNIETEMLDLSNFKDIKDKHKIMSVPALIINDSKVYFGGKKLEDIVQLLK